MKLTLLFFTTKNLKATYWLSAVLIGSFMITSCEDKTPVNHQPIVTDNKVISTNVISDITWSKDTVYELGTRVAVENGAVLTIQAGTIIKGQTGSGSSSTALLVARGGKIIAEGTANAPIIFTSTIDEISIEDINAGNFGSPNLDPSLSGLWGGVIILGKAKISASNDDGQLTELQIEGIPSSDANGLYGGNNDSDNSGVFKYISIRHGGTNIGSGNEINGLTLGGVGSETTISNIEVVANQDDGIEWFGGSVDVYNVLIWNAGDDALDTDQGWRGICSDFIIITPTGSAFELDGPEGTYIADNQTFANGVVYAGDLGGNLIDFDTNTNVDMSSIYFYGVESAITVAEYAEMRNNGGSVANFQYTLPTDIAPDAVFVNIESDHLTSVAANANTVGQTGDYSWTWAAQKGKLTDIGQ